MSTTPPEKPAQSTPSPTEDDLRKARMLAFKRITNALNVLSPNEAKAVLTMVGMLYAE